MPKFWNFFRNPIFCTRRYDGSNNPTHCKLLSLSRMSASSGVVDLVTLLGRALPAAALDKHHLSLLLGYHSHLSRVNS